MAVAVKLHGKRVVAKWGSVGASGCVTCVGAHEIYADESHDDEHEQKDGQELLGDLAMG